MKLTFKYKVVTRPNGGLTIEDFVNLKDAEKAAKKINGKVYDLKQYAQFISTLNYETPPF